MKNNDIHIKIIDQIIGGQSDPDKNKPDNDTDKELLEQYSSIWNNSKNISFPDFDKQKALKRIEFKLNHADLKRKHWKILLVRVAAILVAGVFTFFLLKQVLKDKNDNQIIEIIVNKGEKLTINLPDGNKVWLNSGSAIKYPANFTGFNKRIEIKGEAYFDLKNNGNYPMMISISNTIINCTSSVFNIKSDLQDTERAEIIVEKGSLIISNTQIPNGIELAAGNKASVSRELPLAIEPNYSQNDLAWKTGKIVFDNTPLETVASVLSSYYDLDVKIEGELKYCEFSSTYQNKDIATILEDIKHNYNPRIVRNSSEIIIQGNLCN